jgi:hypothetical protein
MNLYSFKTQPPARARPPASHGCVPWCVRFIGPGWRWPQRWVMRHALSAPPRPSVPTPLLPLPPACPSRLLPPPAPVCLPYVSVLCVPPSPSLLVCLLCLSASSSPPPPACLLSSSSRRLSPLLACLLFCPSPCLSSLLVCLPSLPAPSPRPHFSSVMVVSAIRKERRSAAELAQFGHVTHRRCCWLAGSGGSGQGARSALRLVASPPRRGGASSAR